MKKTLIAFAAATSLALPAAPAMAQHGPPSWAPAHGYRDHDRGHDRYDARYDRRDDRRDRYRDRYDDRRDRYRTYDEYGRYHEPRRVRRGDRVWQGRDGRYYCERENGTTGLIIGAAGGALVGRAIDTRGDRTLGTLLGAVVGGLLGREIDRGEARCR
ncbi:glycine zipper 2TM domain-containing protein [Aurantiacibacter sp. MUD11]|uniref:glycine zipper 2TM domain-containing protein n=1 Tax=Aurantiacibacter sp. MUD11 TaxID=3003265 RepID=UPI0022AB3BBF|nr:glycine zipper 2TM domain-containing protein [Aurantiacibacter sp. MUD11]WAT18019.1 glycine zipper 2TM domain-containing protein [Aurantiacibacter sp. MUD11]